MLKLNDDDAILKIQTACPSCGASIDMESRVVDIPHFKEAIIMSVTCEECGYKSNEVKGSGEIKSHGTKIALRVETINDMSRHVVKSDTACVTLGQSSSDNFPVLILSWLILPIEEINLDDN